MVQRTPGFVFDPGDEEVRGLGGASGNVLIDGRPPSTKTESLEDLLKRIPASAVDRLELIPGAEAGATGAGRDWVLNVVRRRETAREVRIEAGAALARGHVSPSFAMEASGQSGERQWEVSAAFADEIDEESGEGRRVRRDAAGAVSEDADFEVLERQRGADLAGAWRQPAFGGRLRVGGVLNWERAVETLDERSRIGGGDERVRDDEDILDGEASLAFQRDLAGGGLDLIVLQRLTVVEASSVGIEGADAERSDESTTAGETVLRAAYARPLSGAVTGQASLEGAYNFLEGEISLVENGAPVPLPNADSRVEEVRLEAAAGLTWRVSPELTADFGLAVEASELRQSGDVDLTRGFLDLKPRAQVSWAATPDDRLRLTVEREVGQLDFGDFLASTSLDTGVITAGAVDLRPDRRWSVEASWEHAFGPRDSVTLSFAHDEIEDVLDRDVLVFGGDAFDIPANIGDGSEDRVRLAFTLSLDRLGLPGGVLAGDVTRRWTRVRDPVTGEQRPISGALPWEGEVRFSQDIPAHRLRWGFEVVLAEREDEFRFDEIRAEGQPRPLWRLFVERRFGDDWRVRLEAEDLGAGSFRRRTAYDGPRDGSPLDFRERRGADGAPSVSITVQRTWGG